MILTNFDELAGRLVFSSILYMKTHMIVKNDSKLTRIHSFFRFLAQKRKSVRNFDKITTTFIVQTAFYWQRYRDLFCINSPTTVPIFRPPRGHHRYLKRPISITPKVGDFIRRRELPFRPHLHAHIPRMTFVSTAKLPQMKLIPFQTARSKFEPL